jgi:hypothetical protein
MELFKVSAPLGSGKTYAAIEYTGYLARMGYKFIIAQPSKELIAQSVADFRTKWPDVRVSQFHSGLYDNVNGAIASYFSGKPSKEHGQFYESDVGEVVFITHASLFRSPFIANRDKWHVIIDEAPSVLWSTEIKIPNNYRILRKLFKVTECHETWGRLASYKWSAVDRVAKNRAQDQVDAVFKPLCERVLDKNWDLYIRRSQWQNILKNDIDDGRIAVCGLLKQESFNGFASCTIMSANMENTLAYRYLVGQGHQFKTHKHLTKKLRFTSHENGGSLTIHYAFDDDWSKYFRDKPVICSGVESDVGTVIAGAAKKLFDGQDFVWQTNKDIEDRNPFRGYGIQLPHLAHGINKFQHIHNAAILPALNLSPICYGFLSDITKISRNDAMSAIYQESVYQAAGRISLRNISDSNPKNIVLADRATAEWLSGLYPGSQAKDIGLEVELPQKEKIGRPQIYESNAKKCAAYRERKAALIWELLNEAQNDTKLPIKLKALSCHGKRGMMGGSLFYNISAKQPFGEIIEKETGDVVGLLQISHEMSIDKENACLISPAYFGNTGPHIKTKRGLVNITGLGCIIMDNDGGDLKSDEFAGIFPCQEMIICNSYSSTDQNPRWRVFFPVTSIMSVGQHENILSQIERTLNRNGYYDEKQLKILRKNRRDGKRHGFDKSKFNAASLFYLPVQAQSGSKHSFFLHYQGQDRAPIDPEQLCGPAVNDSPVQEPVHAPVHYKPPSIPAMSHTDRSDRIQKAISDWRCAPVGQGNFCFNQLAWRLAGIGVDFGTIREILQEEADNARSRGDRLKQIRYVMGNLQDKLGHLIGGSTQI